MALIQDPGISAISYCGGNAIYEDFELYNIGLCYEVVESLVKGYRVSFLEKGCNGRSHSYELSLYNRVMSYKY